MAEDLFHPPHVAASLIAIEGYRPDELRAAFLIRNSRNPGYVCNEVLVRLVRRSRVDGDREVEGLALEALLERISAWACRTYSSLLPTDQEQMAILLGEVVMRQIATENRVDFWEITFGKKLKRAASDIYQKYFDAKFEALRNQSSLEDCESDNRPDPLEDILEASLIQAKAASILSADEMLFFHQLFLSGIPLSSPRASTDLVRILGRPAGTLREIKTRIKAKLKAAWKEEA